MNEPTTPNAPSYRDVLLQGIVPPSALKGDNSDALLRGRELAAARPTDEDSWARHKRMENEALQRQWRPRVLTPEEQALDDMQKEHHRRAMYQLHGEASKRATTAMPLPEVPADFDAA
jgi:hypothetical protein